MSFLVACGGSSDATIDIVHDVCAPITLTAADATPLQLAGIDDAIALWQVGGVSALAFGAAPGGGGAPTAAAASIEIRFEAASPAFRGLYDDEAGVIYVNQVLTDPAPLAIVIAHELGHAFGLPHVEADERTSLMNPGNLVTPPTDGDLRALEAMWGACD